MQRPSGLAHFDFLSLSLSAFPAAEGPGALEPAWPAGTEGRLQAPARRRAAGHALSALSAVTPAGGRSRSWRQASAQWPAYRHGGSDRTHDPGRVPDSDATATGSPWIATGIPRPAIRGRPRAGGAGGLMTPSPLKFAVISLTLTVLVLVSATWPHTAAQTAPNLKPAQSPSPNLGWSLP